MKNKKKLPKITYEEGAKNWLLDIFDKAVDSDGYIVEKSNQEQRVYTPNGEEITLKELAVIKSGSERFIKGDINSLMEVSKGEV